MTTWYSRVKVFDRFGETTSQRKIDLTGWKDNIKFAVVAIGQYHKMPAADVEQITEQEFTSLLNHAYKGELEVIADDDDLTLAEDGLSASIDSEEYISGVASTQEQALQRYAEAELCCLDHDEWDEEES